MFVDLTKSDNLEVDEDYIDLTDDVIPSAPSLTASPCAVSVPKEEVIDDVAMEKYEMLRYAIFGKAATNESAKENRFKVRRSCGALICSANVVMCTNLRDPNRMLWRCLQKHN